MLRHPIRIVCALSLTFLIAAAGIANAVSDDLLEGKKVGAQMAMSLSLADQDGKTRSLESLKGSKGLILLFTRSLDW